MRITVVAACLLASTALAQTVSNPKASYVDVVSRRAELQKTSDPRTKLAVSELKSCLKLPFVAPPQGRMQIPHHYLSGSHGPTNPAEAAATKVYNAYEHRITAGMNQWLVTGSKDEARCAQDQIDAWAQAATLLDYDPKESSQAWYQVEWTLSSTATTESVLMNEPSLEQAKVARDIQWINKVAHRTVDFDKARKDTNNHHYWRALAAMATGVISNDNDLFSWAVGVYKQGINELDARGAFPQEMARHERAIHYQSFALQPLTPLASFAERQHVPLYSYTSPTGKSIRDAVNFMGAAVADPQIVKAYTPDEQMTDFDAPDFYAFAEFYAHDTHPTDLPAAIVQGLSKPTFATRIGGSTTVLAGYVPPKSE